MLNQARDAQFLLQPFTLLRLDLLFAHQLRHAHGRRSLRGEVVEQGAIVGRVVLIAQARAEIQQADQFALRHQRHDQPRARFAQLTQGGRIEMKFVDLDHAGRTAEVGHQRIGRSEIQRSDGGGAAWPIGYRQRPRPVACSDRALPNPSLKLRSKVVI